jgi:HEPN domain-containing protein
MRSPLVNSHSRFCGTAFKGYLTLQQIFFERRHDLSYLIDLCVPLDDDFGQFRVEADELTPYAVEFRYPDALPVMPLEHAQAAVEAAERIYAFVVARLA